MIIVTRICGELRHGKSKGDIEDEKIRRLDRNTLLPAESKFAVNKKKKDLQGNPR